MNLDHEHVTHDIGEGDLRSLYAAHRRRSDSTEMPAFARRYYERMADSLRDTILDRDEVLGDLAEDLRAGDGQTGGIVTDPAAEVEAAQTELRRAVRREAGVPENE